MLCFQGVDIALLLLLAPGCQRYGCLRDTSWRRCCSGPLDDGQCPPAARLVRALFSSGTDAYLVAKLGLIAPDRSQGTSAGLSRDRMPMFLPALFMFDS